MQPSYPYGTDTGSGQQATPGDDFATYLKDSSTGFEYAMNRYYSAGYGRFLTVDPFGGSARVSNPATMNRYAYAIGDPLNRIDATGKSDADSGADFGGICLGANLSDECGINGNNVADDGLGVSTDDDSSCPVNGSGSANGFGPEGDGTPPPCLVPPVLQTLLPKCSISEYERPAGGKHRPWYHTYVVIDDPFLKPSGYAGNPLILQAGPSNDFPIGGSLKSQIALPGTGLGENKGNPSNPGATGNKEIGTPYTKPDACLDIILLLEAISNYDHSKQVPYLAVPFPGLSYNSNSFTSTLLSDIGLSFGSPGFAPGWGPLFRVPGLVP